MMKIISSILMLGLLAGCGATPIREISPSTYSSQAQYGSLNGSWDRAQQEATANAKAFCTAKGQTFIFISEQRTGVYGWSPQSSTITFTCGADTNALLQSALSQCEEDMKTPELDPIRIKVELIRTSPDSPVPFAIATNDSFPTEVERKAIAKWATIREGCVNRSEAAFSIPPSATPLQVTQIQQDRSFEHAMTARVNDLIVSLYQQKLTYGEFAKKRYEITMAAADAERQFRLSVQIADRQKQMEAQQLAQQRFQNSLMEWSIYQQSVNARLPQTVHLDGSVRVQSNCFSQRIGNTVNTNCN